MKIYSATYVFNWSYILFLIPALAIWGLFIWYIKKFINVPGKYTVGQKVFGIIFVGLFCSIFSLCWLMVDFFYAQKEYLIYSDTLKKYNNGDYLEVEGYVKDFKVHQDSDAKTDDIRFEVDGTVFEVYQNDYWAFWYNGNDINKDGQYVRLKYNPHTQFGKKRNYIMEIEFLDMEQ